MIFITKHPGTYCFVGNPMIYELEISSDWVSVELILGTKNVKLNLIPYKADTYNTYPYKVTIDISDIIQALIGTELITIQQGNMIELVSNFSFKCDIHLSDHNTITPSTINVFRGGISKLAREILINYDLDMFSYRLNNPTRNFLFTTRTNGHHLCLRETELYPFAFIHPELSVSFVSTGGRIVTIPQEKAGQVCSVDFVAVRLVFAKLYNEYPSFLVVRVGQNYSFDITFTPNQITENNIRLLFKNSLGAYEIIEVTGKAELTPEFSEENTYQSLNSNYDFDTFRDRLFCQQIIEAETGYKNKDELLFIQDVIASDEIYLLEDNRFKRCHVSVDTIKIDKKIVIPTSILLKITLVDNEQYQTPDIDFSYPSYYPLVNITRKLHPELNGLGLIYGDEIALHGE